MHKPILALAIAAALCAGASSTSVFAQDAVASAQTMATAPMSAKAAQLDKFYTDFWEASLKLNPIQANERQVLLQMLEQQRWNVSNVAKALDVSRNTLYRKLHKLHIEVSHPE